MAMRRLVIAALRKDGRAFSSQILVTALKKDGRAFSSQIDNDGQIRRLFQDWCKKNGNTYASAEEREYRLQVFKETCEFVTGSGRAVSKDGMGAITGVKESDIDDGVKESYIDDGMGAITDRKESYIDDGVKESDIDDDNDTKIRLVFQNWCKKYGKTYASAEESERRLQIFKKKYEFVTRHNAETHSYRVGLNHLSAHSEEEFKAMHPPRSRRTSLLRLFVGSRPIKSVKPSDRLIEYLVNESLDLRDLDIRKEMIRRDRQEWDNGPELLKEYLLKRLQESQGSKKGAFTPDQASSGKEKGR